jgi:hypothetical protein
MPSFFARYSGLKATIRASDEEISDDSAPGAPSDRSVKHISAAARKRSTVQPEEGDKKKNFFLQRSFVWQGGEGLGGYRAGSDPHSPVAPFLSQSRSPAQSDVQETTVVGDVWAETLNAEAEALTWSLNADEYSKIHNTRFMILISN